MMHVSILKPEMTRFPFKLCSVSKHSLLTHSPSTTFSSIEIDSHHGSFVYKSLPSWSEDMGISFTFWRLFSLSEEVAPETALLVTWDWNCLPEIWFECFVNTFWYKVEMSPQPCVQDYPAKPHLLHKSHDTGEPQVKIVQISLCNHLVTQLDLIWVLHVRRPQTHWHNVSFVSNSVEVKKVKWSGERKALVGVPNSFWLITHAHCNQWCLLKWYCK